MNDIIVIDCPKLQSIELGKRALCQRDCKYSFLVMSGIIEVFVRRNVDLPSLVSLTSLGASFVYPNMVIFESKMQTYTLSLF